MKRPIPVCVSLITLAVAACKPERPSAPAPVPGESTQATPDSSPDGAAGAKAAAVEAKIREIVVEQLGILADRVRLASTWKELGADSLDHVELIMAFEEEFKVEISDEHAEKMKTVGDATSYMTKHGKL